MPRIFARLASWTFPLTARRIIAVTALLAVAVFILSAAIDRALMVSGSSSCGSIVFVTNILLATLAGLLFWTRSWYLRNRLRTIAGLNHDIRNALHAISLSMYLASPNVEIINESVERIDRALREFVPQTDWKP